MPEEPELRQIRFDAYEIDLKEAEVRKAGQPVKLAPQPFRILALLASRPGETVAREEIQRAVWGGETFVDFEVGLNQCIRQIRGALGDDAQHPRFIETMSRRGYRFIAPVTVDEAEENEDASQRAAPVPETKTGVESAEVLMPATDTATADAAALPPQVKSSETGVSTPRRHRAIWVLAAIAAVAIIVFAIYGAGLRTGGFLSGVFRERQADPIRSLAVLPFRNLSGDPGQEYFAEGMTDQLITDLAQIRELRVISRTSVSPYKETRKTLPVIARELNVDAVVEGSVVRLGNRVKVTAQLVQAQPERHVWAKSFERNAADALSLESDIAEEIAGEIRLKLTPQERTKLDPHRSENPAALEAYLRGQFCFQQSQTRWNESAEAPLSESIRYFERAIQLDPEYAGAYAGEAQAYDSLLSMDARNKQILQPAEISAKLTQAALKALQIDRNNARAHVALGWDRFIVDWNWSGAGAEFEQAVASEPGYAAGRIANAMYLCAMGRTGEAIAQVQAAERIDPASPMTRFAGGWVFYHARQYDRAIQENRAAATLAPESARAHDALGWTMVKRGLFPQAAAEFRTAARLSNDAESLEAYTAYLDAAAGKRAEALSHLRALEAQRTPTAISPYVRAEIYAALGDRDQAFTNLENAYEQRSFEMVYLRSDPDVDSLRSDPRFAALERRMNLPL